MFGNSSKIQVGEIIGYRAWRSFDKTHCQCVIDSRTLFSLFQDTLWERQLPLEAKPNLTNQEGIYSFKTKEIMLEKIGVCHFVLGTVKIWGDIIEHELGYRSQYAKINSLICFNINCNDLHSQFPNYDYYKNYIKYIDWINYVAKWYNCEVVFDDYTISD